MYKCKKCNFKTENKSDIANHYRWKHTQEDRVYCPYCGKEFYNKACSVRHIKNKFCLRKKERKRIRKDAPKKPYPRIECKICGKMIMVANIYMHLQGHKTRRKKAITKRLAELNGWRRGMAFTKEGNIKKSEKLRQAILKRYTNGWEPRAGKTKKISYKSSVAGDIHVDGTWELGVAIYLDQIGVKWNRNTKRFKYHNEIKERESTYCPDFFIQDWHTYLEVKGYETELDRIKWKQFKEGLIVWEKKKLLELGIIDNNNKLLLRIDTQVG